MGLDTSHGCFHGPYSQFMTWRSWINLFVLYDRAANGDNLARDVSNMGACREAVIKAWDLGLYDDQTVPINVLMRHSDCDGEIPAEVCGPLADALQDIAHKRMTERGTYDMMRPATMRFIAGLRLAASNNEPVRFS